MHIFLYNLHSTLIHTFTAAYSLSCTNNKPRFNFPELVVAAPSYVKQTMNVSLLTFNFRKHNVVLK